MKTGKVIIALMFLAISASVYSEENVSNFNEIGLVFSNLNSFGLRYKFGNDNIMFRVTSLTLNGTTTSNDYSNYSVNGIADGNIPNNTTKTAGAGLNLGFEKRIWINNRFNFYYGIDWINSYTQSHSNTILPNSSIMTKNDTNYTAFYNNTNSSFSWTVSSGLGVICGSSYKINESFSIAAELEPTISYKYTKTTTSTTNSDIQWSTTAGVETPNVNTYNNSSQTTINKGFTGSLTNAAASIVITYRFKCGSQKAK